MFTMTSMLKLSGLMRSFSVLKLDILYASTLLKLTKKPRPRSMVMSSIRIGSSPLIFQPLPKSPEENFK